MKTPDLMTDLHVLLRIGDVKFSSVGSSGRVRCSVMPPKTPLWWYAEGATVEEAVALARDKAAGLHCCLPRVCENRAP